MPQPDDATGAPEPRLAVGPLHEFPHAHVRDIGVTHPDGVSFVLRRFTVQMHGEAWHAVEVWATWALNRAPIPAYTIARAVASATGEETEREALNDVWQMRVAVSEQLAAHAREN